MTNRDKFLLKLIDMPDRELANIYCLYINELKINKCCATCKHYAEYERKDGVVVCGCYYYDMMCDKSTIDINKCNCLDGEGWECEDGRE